MRRASRIDKNQPKLVAFLRSLGASVRPTHTLGEGFPDLIIGYNGVNYLAEIKDPKKPLSKRQLTQDQVEFFHSWRGQKSILMSEKDCLVLLGIDRVYEWKGEKSILTSEKDCLVLLGIEE